MDFADLTRTRRSVRRYADAEVEQEKLDSIIESARLAPSWANKQCWNYIVVKKRELIEQIAAKGAGLPNGWLGKAPVVIVACADPRRSGTKNGMDYYLVDVGISMEHLSLQAADLGLGTCWIGWFDEDAVKRVLGIPEGIKVVALTPVGYPAEESGIRAKLTKILAGSAKRKPVEEIVHKDMW